MGENRIGGREVVDVPFVGLIRARAPRRVCIWMKYCSNHGFNEIKYDLNANLRNCYYINKCYKTFQNVHRHPTKLNFSNNPSKLRIPRNRPLPSNIPSSKPTIQKKSTIKPHQCISLSTSPICQFKNTRRN